MSAPERKDHKLSVTPRGLEGCQSFYDSTVHGPVKAHLWPVSQNAYGYLTEDWTTVRDSASGKDWYARRCMACGAWDIEAVP